MAVITLADCILDVDNGGDRILLKWRDRDASQNVTEIFYAGLELVEHTGGSQWLADLRQLGGFSAAIQEDLREVWLTQLSLCGVDELAIVEPVSYTGQMCVENIFDNSPRHFVTIRRFNSRTAAETWLDWRSLE